jgi:hypothetical protein
MLSRTTDHAFMVDRELRIVSVGPEAHRDLQMDEADGAGNISPI